MNILFSNEVLYPGKRMPTQYDVDLAISFAAGVPLPLLRKFHIFKYRTVEEIKHIVKGLWPDQITEQRFPNWF